MHLYAAKIEVLIYTETCRTSLSEQLVGGVYTLALSLNKEVRVWKTKLDEELKYVESSMRYLYISMLLSTCKPFALME
jgi:hypothetical protein